MFIFIQDAWCTSTITHWNISFHMVCVGSVGSVQIRSSECASIWHTGQWLHNRGSSTCPYIAGQELAGCEGATIQWPSEGYLCECCFISYAWNFISCISVTGLCTIILPVFSIVVNCDREHKFQPFKKKLKEIMMGLICSSNGRQEIHT
jgi:hypothetical protein